jgi:glucose/arabinose dehydrogenase
VATLCSLISRMASAILLLALALGATACGGEEEDDRPARAGGSETSELGAQPRVETVATGLEIPWEIAFLPDGSAFVTERPGRVRLLDPEGRLQAQPVAEVGVSAQGEGGLLGLALDPSFESNGFVYLYYTAGAHMEVARFRYGNGGLQLEAILIDGIVAGPIHDSGRIHFGPDDRLYISTGDAGQAELAQDEGSLNGKFLRLDPDAYRGGGGQPEVLSSGHRNPQGFDWEPGSERLIASEHGETGFDEINQIEEGANYGWPEVVGPDHGDFTAPVVTYEDTIAPSGATFVSEEGSAWTGDLLVAALAGQQLRRVRLEDGDVSIDEPLFEGRFGRMRTVVEGPDGALYALTNNRDGRGAPRDGDDRIIRIVPPQD